MNRWIKGLVNFGLLAVSLGLFLIAAEFFLRAVNFKPPQIVTQEKYKDVYRLYQPNSSGFWCGRLGQAIDFENWVTTNSLALHDSEHTFAKKPGVYRILFLGDSFLEAWQVPLEDTFFKILEKDLNRNSRKLFNKDSVEVIAIGRSGAGSVVEVKDLKELGFQYSPDLVMTLITDQNDFKDDVFMMDRLKNPAKYRQRPNLFKNIHANDELEIYERLIFFKTSLLNRWLAFQVFQILQRPKAEAERRSAYGEDMGIYEKDGERVFDQSRETWKNAFLIVIGNHVEMARFSEEKGAGYRAVFIPNTFIIEPKASRDLYRIFPHYKGKLDFKRPSELIKIGFDKYRVSYLDLNEGFLRFFTKSNKSLHFRHDGHWNKEGHRLAAELIGNYLEKEINEGKLKT